MLPVFPLTGVLLLPGGRLPLHIFEPRYLNMVTDALGGERLIGMVQPRAPEEASTASSVGDGADVYETGCAGRITEFSETPDGRFLIALTGVSRFRIADELSIERGYRRVRPDWTPYLGDLDNGPGVLAGRERLLDALEGFFSGKGIASDWAEIREWPDITLVATLAMMCPFDAGEKQALLECGSWEDRVRLLITLMEIAAHEGEADTPRARH
ncbi:MAG: LON peptidase substrate-binding domain-containing protein [Rhodospirillales bacterium]